MADTYLAMSQIANDTFMQERMRACVTQQVHLGNAPLIVNDPTYRESVMAIDWVSHNRYIWAASPTWAEKWAYALDTHSDDPDYEPGKDEAVITDADILSVVQDLTGP